jgi:hypothetical protein
MIWRSIPILISTNENSPNIIKQSQLGVENFGSGEVKLIDKPKINSHLQDFSQICQNFSMHADLELVQVLQKIWYPLREGWKALAWTSTFRASSSSQSSYSMNL